MALLSLNRTPMWTYQIDSSEMDNDEGDSYAEGRVSYAIHKRIERNSQLIKEVKAKYLYEKGELRCNACNFSFLEKYGDVGKKFIEVHHTLPVSEAGERNTKIDDCVIVCSNCRRMLHIKRPCLQVNELKELLIR
jgi:5-methylcytosine-specific restriction protein A